jgi:Family of unknown function (DUF6527)
MTETVAVLRPWSAGEGRQGTRLYLWCPGCDDLHAVEVTDPGFMWEWDGNLESPTISPSIKVDYGVGGRICHSYVKQGRWEFLSDCTHALAGQSVALPPLPEWITREKKETNNEDEGGNVMVRYADGRTIDWEN